MPLDLLLFSYALRVALLVGAALGIVALARRASAAMRHAVLIAALGSSLALPILGALLPPFSPVTLPAPVDSRRPTLISRWSDSVTAILLVRSEDDSAVPVRVPVRSIPGRREAVLVIWLLGSAVVLYRIGRDYFGAARALARARLARARLARAHASSGRGVPFVESAEIGTPATVGLLRPAILIPTRPVFPRDALPWVVAHELSHVARRDCLTQLVARLACAVYWFNPLVWKAAERVALEQERACDDRVLAGGADPIGYSNLLLDVARRQTAAPIFAPAMARRAHLERRIAGILDPSARRGGLSLTRIAALGLVMIGILVPLASFALLDRPAPGAADDPYFDPSSERVEGVRAASPEVTPGIEGSIDAALIDALRAAASRESRSPGDLVPERARWALSVARGGRIIEPLIEQLSNDDWRVRGYAAWALGSSRDRRAVEPLLPLLREPVWRLRAGAASALRTIGDPRATGAMAAALSDPAWQVRVEAVAFLGSLHDTRFRERVEPLRNDPHIAVRLAAEDALDSLR